MSRFSYFLPLGFLVLLLLTGCRSTAPYHYKYVPGRTAVLRGAQAVAPEEAPRVVREVIAAGNRIAGLPYRYGAGHHPAQTGVGKAYDCSGAASYVLRSAGLLERPMSSREFRRYGDSGAGKWITVYARRGHVFLVVAGLRFDTGFGKGARGPRWLTRDRPTKGCVLRHPAGL